MTYKAWAKRLLESDARRVTNFRAPYSLNALILLVLIVIDVSAVEIELTGPLAAICTYLSALTLIVELLEQAFFAAGAMDILKPNEITKKRNEIIGKWLKKEPLTEAERHEAKLRWKQILVVATFFWYVISIRVWLRKSLGLLPWTAWVEDRDIKADTYLLRFWAFVFLILAINFDILRRVFS